MPPQKTEWDKQMQHLESEIRRLEAEFNMFFAGRLPRPPWETKARVAALIKQHDQSYIRNTADRFRFESLQNRHQKFIELCDRQLTNRELGRPMLGVRRAEPEPPKAAAPTRDDAAELARELDQAAAPKAPQAPKAPKTPEHVVKFGRDAGDARVKELYEELSAAKKAAGEAPVEFERVKALVKAQVSKFGDEGAKVAFKIATKDGKVSLTVKAEKDGEGSS